MLGNGEAKEINPGRGRQTLKLMGNPGSWEVTRSGRGGGDTPAADPTLSGDDAPMLAGPYASVRDHFLGDRLRGEQPRATEEGAPWPAPSGRTLAGTLPPPHAPWSPHTPS